MGNVKDLVKQHIKSGPGIACNVGVHHLLTSGVSNWGGWALAMSAFLLNNCLLHSRYQRYGIGLYRYVRPEDVLNSFQQVMIKMQLSSLQTNNIIFKCNKKSQSLFL